MIPLILLAFVVWISINGELSLYASFLKPSEDDTESDTNSTDGSSMMPGENKDGSSGGFGDMIKGLFNKKSQSGTAVDTSRGDTISGYSGNDTLSSQSSAETSNTSSGSFMDWFN